MSANLQPISSDGGFVTAGNITVSLTSTLVSSPAPYINGFASINTTLGGNLGGFSFNSNGIAFVPGETTFRSNNDTISLISYDTPNSTSRGMRLGTDGGLYLEQTGLIPINNRTWLTINPNAGNVEMSASIGIFGSTAGGNLSIAGGAADQTTFNTSPGGNVNITGGLGASDDGGGGGTGGSVNITAGASADTAGVAGNVTINTGSSNTWTFDNTGNLTLPGSISSNIGGATLVFGSATASAFPGLKSTTNITFTANSAGTPQSMYFYGDGALTTPGAITSVGKIGYANGGTATQSGTGQGVTINQLTGQITLAKSSWNAGDTEVFNISCNKIANTDYVMAQVINGSEASYFNTVSYPFTAVANSIRVQVTAVVASTATPVVQFLILKAATS